MRQVILAIDEGTSGTRAAVVGADGHVAHQAYRPLRVDSPAPGVVEQDADDILAKTLDACRDTLQQARQHGLEVVALALATQRATAVLWDTHTGRALVPAMVWQDTRYAAELATLAPRWDPVLLARAGRPVGVRSPYLWAVHHLRETPAVAEAHRQGWLAYGTVDTWLLWHLSDRRARVTTPTNATSANAYVLAEHRFLGDWLDQLGFPAELSPTLHQDADDFGHTRPELLGLRVPIRASAGDQHAGAIGLGCLEPGQTMCVHGTGSFVDQMAGAAVPPPGTDATFTMCARRQHGVTHFAVETFVATTGSALNWVCDKLHWFERPAQISDLAAQVDSARGLTFIPALTGLRVPQMQPRARASVTGLSMASTREELAYALLEGIAHSVVSCAEANESVTGHATPELVVGGGLSGSGPLLQMQANLMGRPMRRTRETDCASLRGIAFLAGSQGLLWDSLEQACANVQTDTVFEPALGADERQARRALWQRRIATELATELATPGDTAPTDGKGEPKA